MANRANYAAFVTVLLAVGVLTLSSTMVLQFEGTDPKANITTGGDAIWCRLSRSPPSATATRVPSHPPGVLSPYS